MNRRLVLGLQCLRLSCLGLCLIFVLLISESESFSKYDRKNWVNPDDMINYDRASKTMIRPNANNREFQGNEKSTEPPVSKDCTKDNAERENALKEKLSSCETALSSALEGRGHEEPSPDDTKESMSERQYLRRFVNVLLRAAGLTEGIADTAREASVLVRVTVEHLAVLRRFGGGEGGPVPLAELDDVLTQVLGSPDAGFGLPVTWLERLARAFSIDSLYRLLPYAITLVTLSMLVIRRPLLEIATTFLVLVLALSYQWTYDYMVKMAEVRQYVTLQQLPDSCRGRADWSLYDYLVHRLTHDADECGRYRAAQTLDAALEVTPTLVLSEMLSAMLVHPAAGLGRGVARYSAAVLGGLPMFWNWVVLLLSFVLFALVVVLVIVVICGGRLRLPYLLSGLEVTGGQPACPMGPRVAVQEIPANPLVTAISSSTSEGLVLMNMPILERLMSAREDRAANTQQRQRLAPVGPGGNAACCSQCGGGDSDTRVARVDTSRGVIGGGDSDTRVATVPETTAGRVDSDTRVPTVHTLSDVREGRGKSDRRVDALHTSHDVMAGRSDSTTKMSTVPELTGGRGDSGTRVATVHSPRNDLMERRGDSNRKVAPVPVYTLHDVTGERGSSDARDTTVDTSRDVAKRTADSDRKVSAVRTSRDVTGGRSDCDTRVATEHSLHNVTGEKGNSDARVNTLRDVKEGRGDCDRNVSTSHEITGGRGDFDTRVSTANMERISKGDPRLAGGDFARVVAQTGGEAPPPLVDSHPLERSGFIDELRKILDESDGDQEGPQVSGTAPEGRPDFVDTLANLLEECEDPEKSGTIGTNSSNSSDEVSGAELIRKVSSDSSDASGDFVKL